MIYDIHILNQCLSGDRSAQQTLYQSLSPTLMAICRRYLKVTEEAEDILVETFVKIFKNLPKFKNQGSFEGWCKRIAVNECLMHLRKKQHFHLSIEYAQHVAQNTVEIHDQMSYEELITLMDELPAGYRTIFNLYVIEGYKHKEIAEQLGISINTSKSQLIHAKRRLKVMIKKKQSNRIG